MKVTTIDGRGLNDAAWYHLTLLEAQGNAFSFSAPPEGEENSFIRLICTSFRGSSKPAHGARPFARSDVEGNGFPVANSAYVLVPGVSRSLTLGSLRAIHFEPL